MRRRGLTCKKKTQHADERDRPDVQEKRRSFRRKVKRVDSQRLVFVDETGVTTAMTRAYAWAPRGERAHGSAPGSWESLTVIAALGLDGVRAPLVFSGSTDTAAFESYVEQVLVPELHAGDVVVWDNLSPHQAYAAAAAVKRAGARLLPLPPYSPDFTPIEKLWSKVKAYLRRVAARSKGAVYDALGAALERVTLKDIIGWFQPRHESGELRLDEETFREVARSYQEVSLMRELRVSLSRLRLEDLAVGSDGRNRTLLAPFGCRDDEGVFGPGCKTGCNTPSTSKYIFGPATWLRGLIAPGPERALAYIDWCQQEFGIAASLSGDQAMMSAYRSGDPYLAFGKQAGRIPADGTKETHRVERELFKACAWVCSMAWGQKR